MSDDIFTSIGDFFTGAGDVISTGAQAVGDAATSGLDFLGDTAASVAGGASQLFGNVFDGAGGSFEGGATGNFADSADFGAGLGGDVSNVASGAIGNDASSLSSLAASSPAIAGSAAPGGGTSAFAAGLAPGNAGFDDIARSNFALEDTANPYGSATVSNTVAPMAAGAAKPETGWFQAAKDFIKNPPAGAVIGGGLLAANALRQTTSNPAAPAQRQIQSQTIPQVTQVADQLQSQGTTAVENLNAGRLPPGMEATIEQNLKGQEASIRSRFAGMGLSGSSMEAQALNQARLASRSSAIDSALKVATPQLNALAQAGSLYGNAGNFLTGIAQQQLSQDDQLSNAIANFAAALAGGGNTAVVPQVRRAA